MRSLLCKIGDLDEKSSLKEMKAQLSDKLVLGHPNIDSIRNKFETLTFIIDNNIDILLISETKLDDSFPTAQFLIKVFSGPYRFDRNSKGGGLLLYIHEDIPSKILTCSSNCDIETLLVEINLRKRKWLFNGFYNPNKSQISHHNYRNYKNHGHYVFRSEIQSFCSIFSSKL